LTKEAHGLPKKKERCVLWGGSDSRFGCLQNLLCGNSKSHGHKARIIEIQVGPTTQLRDNEIDGR
jgi:hypothetical protein